MDRKKRIAAIGECMIELQQHHDGSLQQSFGGDTLNAAVLARLPLVGSVLVKGSRSMKMERVVQHLLGQQTQEAH